MNRIQESDETHVAHVKIDMERFAKSVTQLGENFKARGEEMQQAVGMVS